MKLEDVSEFHGRAVLDETKNGKGVKPIIREHYGGLMITQHALNREQVIEMIDHLQRWVDYGYL